MKTRIILLLAVSALHLSLAFGQRGQMRHPNKGTRQDPEARAKQVTITMTEKLGLTGDQAEKVRTITHQRFVKMTEIRSQNIEDNAARADKINGIKKQYQNELKDLLTPDQKEKAVAWRKELQAKKAERRANMQLKDAELLEGIE